MKDSPVRQNIVETASRLFYQNGYNLTGINEIIKEAGIAKATLYHHFKSKNDICLAYLQYKQETFLADASAYMKRASKGKDQLLALFDFLALFFKNKDFNGCWCIKTVAEIPREDTLIKKEIQEQKNRFLKMLEEFVSENLEGHTKKERQLLSRQIYLLYEGAVAESHLHQAPWPIAAAKEICAKLIA